MLKIAVCDDEEAFLTIMSKLIHNRFGNMIEKVDSFTSPLDLLDSFELYDLIFLDIDMPEINGIDLVKKYELYDAPVIFVTNKEELVFDAYNTTNTFGFIRKSKLNSDFVNVIKRFEEHSQSLHYLPVKSKDGIVKVKFSDIYYIEKQINHVMIHTKSNIFKTPDTLSNLEKILCKFGFVRTHIGYIINLDYVIRVGDTEVEIVNEEKIPVSRSREKSVKTEFLKRSISVNE